MSGRATANSLFGYIQKPTVTFLKFAPLSFVNVLTVRSRAEAGSLYSQIALTLKFLEVLYHIIIKYTVLLLTNRVSSPPPFLLYQHLKVEDSNFLSPTRGYMPITAF